MLFVRRCPLSVVRCMLFVCLPHVVVRCSLCVVVFDCNWLFAVCCQLCGFCCWLFVVCCGLLFVARRLLFVVCCWWLAVDCWLFVVGWSLCAVR